MSVELSNQVRAIIQKASREKVKGSYAMYERYKQEILPYVTSTPEYTEACRQIAKALKV